MLAGLLLIVPFLLFFIYDKYRLLFPKKGDSVDTDKLRCRVCKWTGPRASWEQAGCCPKCNWTEMQKTTIFNNPDYPVWYLCVNIFNLVPILLWPLVMVGCAFMYIIGIAFTDCPSCKPEDTIFICSLVAAYPVYLVFLVLLSILLFKCFKVVAQILSLSTLAALMFCIYKICSLFF